MTKKLGPYKVGDELVATCTTSGGKYRNSTLFFVSVLTLDVSCALEVDFAVFFPTSQGSRNVQWYALRGEGNADMGAPIFCLRSQYFTPFIRDSEW